VRHYDVAVASLAINAPIKWTDNLLSHHAIPGVVAERRGVARRISYDGLLLLALVRELHVTLEMSARGAVSAARMILAPAAEGVLQSGHLRVVVDRLALARAVDRQLREALETAPIRRRGRPAARPARIGP
jgi:hypothetical protein